MFFAKILSWKEVLAHIAGCKMLRKKEASLKHLEEFLKKKEQQLDKKEEELKKQAEILEMKIRGYLQKKKALEQPVPIPLRQDLQLKAETILMDFRSVREDFTHVQQSLVDMRHLILKTQDTGIEELCWLHRDMAASSDPKVHRAAVNLEEILRNTFGAQIIVPEPGSWFNPQTSIREEGSGSKVIACQHCGWKWGNSILYAVVTTEE